MPSKETYLVAFLATSAILGGIQFFVFAELRRYIRQYFAEKAPKWVPRFRWLFIVMNFPIAFIFFRRQIVGEWAALTNIILYPFTIWVFLMLFWAMILAVSMLVRVLRSFNHKA